MARVYAQLGELADAEIQTAAANRDLEAKLAASQQQNAAGRARIEAMTKDSDTQAARLLDARYTENSLRHALRESGQSVDRITIEATQLRADNSALEERLALLFKEWKLKVATVSTDMADWMNKANVLLDEKRGLERQLTKAQEAMLQNEEQRKAYLAQHAISDATLTEQIATYNRINKQQAANSQAAIDAKQQAELATEQAHVAVQRLQRDLTAATNVIDNLSQEVADVSAQRDDAQKAAKDMEALNTRANADLAEATALHTAHTLVAAVAEAAKSTSAVAAASDSPAPRRGEVRSVAPTKMTTSSTPSLATVTVLQRWHDVIAPYPPAVVQSALHQLALNIHAYSPNTATFQPDTAEVLRLLKLFDASGLTEIDYKNALLEAAVWEKSCRQPSVHHDAAEVYAVNRSIDRTLEQEAGMACQSSHYATSVQFAGTPLAVRTRAPPLRIHKDDPHLEEVMVSIGAYYAHQQRLQSMALPALVDELEDLRTKRLRAQTSTFAAGTPLPLPLAMMMTDLQGLVNQACADRIHFPLLEQVVRHHLAALELLTLQKETNSIEAQAIEH